MAQIVFGAGSSHTLLLNAEPDDWSYFIERDLGLEHLDKEGVPTTYEDLLRQADQRIAELTTPAAMAETHTRCQAALDRLKASIEAAKLDALIIVGDDQQEMLHGNNMPALLVYWGETIRNAPVYYRNVFPWLQPIVDRYFDDGAGRDYPVHHELALHIIDTLVSSEIDVSTSNELRADQGEGHAFGFVHKRLMNGPPVPIIPVCLNTYYPPNRPTPKRCYAIGQAIATAVRSYPEDLRVGVLASGGLSHFTVDEQLDRLVIEALAAKDATTLQSIPLAKLQAGSSEIRNWICIAGSVEPLTLKWSEYFPGYRTPAGTGTGICVAAWE